MKKISTKGLDFIDENGNKVNLRGVNMVCKDKSRNYIGAYSDKDFAFIKSLGMNVVRLGIFWDGVEPEPGKYSEEYLSKIDEIISLAAKNDVCVYLDMHQDLYSAEFEDGAPSWATITDGNEYFKTELWSDAYLMCPAVQIAFDNFWNNAKAPDGKGLLDHYEEMWKFIAARYSNNPYVIGYDVLNEPFPGSSANQVVEVLFATIARYLPPEFFAGAQSEEDVPLILMQAFSDPQKKSEMFGLLDNPEVLMNLVNAVEPVTARFEEQYLNPFYERIGRAVKDSDPDALFMLETNYFSNAGIKSHVLPAKDKNGIQLTNQVYAPHGYDIFVDTELYDKPDFTRVELIFENHRAKRDELNLPVIIGEWGCFPQASEVQLAQVKYLRGKFEEMNFGDTYYEYAHLVGKEVLSWALSVK